MTLGLAVSCASGAVLMADSMHHDMTAEGRVPRPGRKLHYLPAPRTWAMQSGYIDVLPALGALIEKTDFRPAIAETFDVIREVEQKKIAQGRLAGKDDVAYRDYETTGAPQLLAARAWPDEIPRLARLSPTREDWPAPGEAAILPVGCWVRDYLEPEGLLAMVPPATLDGCRDLAVSWGRRYLKEIHASPEFRDPRMAPTVSWPLTLITIDASGRTTEEEIAA